MKCQDFFTHDNTCSLRARMEKQLHTIFIMLLFTLGPALHLGAQISVSDAGFYARIDSLKESLRTAGSDTAAFEAHVFLLEELVSVDAEECLMHTLAARGFAKFKHGWISPYWLNYEGMCNDDLGNFAKAVEAYKGAIDLTHAIMEGAPEEHVLFNHAEPPGWTYDWDMVIYHNNLGYSYFNMGNYAAALDNYNLALDYAVEGDCPDISLVYGSIAELYYAIGDLAQARKYIRDSRQTATDSATLMIDASLLGNIFLSENKLDSANLFYESMLRNREVGVLNYNKAIAYEGLSAAALQGGQYQRSLVYADSCLSVSTRLGSAQFEVNALLLKARAFMELKRYDDAYPLLQRANVVAGSAGLVAGLESYYNVLADYYERTGNYEAAFQNYRMSRTLRDSLLNVRHGKQLAQIALERQIREQSEVTARLREQLSMDQGERTRSAAIIVALWLFALLSGLVAFYIMRRRNAMVIADSPLMHYEPKDDKRIFMQRIAATMALLFIPPIVYAMFWNPFFDRLILMTAFGVCVLVFFVARYSRHFFYSSVVLMMLGYPIIALTPLHTGPVPTFMIWIVAVYLILAYTLQHYRWHIVNALLAVTTYLAFNYSGRISGIEQPSGRDPLELIIGLIGLFMVFMALYYHRGKMFEYRLGLNWTSRFLRLVSDLNPSFIFATNLERKYVFANNAMVKNYGSTLGDIVGKVPEELEPAYKDDPHFIQDDLTVLNSGKVIHVEKEQLYGKNGSPRWVETIKQPVKDEHGKIIGLVGIAMDVTEKQEALDRLEDSLSLLSATLESTADALVVVDQDLRFKLFNSKFEEMWADAGHEFVPEGEIRIRAFANLMKDPEGFKSRVAEIMQNKTAESFDILELRDGRTLERYSQPQLVNGVAVGRVWSFRDVTDAVATTRALRESEQLYRTILEDNLFAVIRTSNSKVLMANRAFSSLVKYSMDELAQLRSHELIHPADLSRYMDAASEVMNSPQAAKNITCRVVTREGSSRYVIASLKGYRSVEGAPPDLVVTFADITELKETETALKESEERYRSLVEASPDGILIADSNGYVTFISDQLRTMMELSSDDKVIGRHLLEFSIPEEYERAKADFTRALKSYEPIFSRYQVGTDSGRSIYVELGARRIDNSKGQPIGSILVMRDVSAQVSQETELRESELKYRTLFESTFDGFVIINNLHQLEDGNRSAIELFGCKDLQTLRTFALYDFFSKQDYNETLQSLFLEDLDRTPPLRVTGSNLQGESVYAELSFAVMHIEGQRKVVCAIRDVAEKVVLETRERTLRQQEIEMETLNRELTANALFASQKNKLLSEIQEDIRTAKHGMSESQRVVLDKINRKISYNLNEQEDALAFRLQFEKVHPNFFNRLLQLCPRLTNHELRYCAYIRLNMSTQDICNLLYVEKKSVEMSKYRIKKKLGLERRQRLSEFLHTL